MKIEEYEAAREMVEKISDLRNAIKVVKGNKYGLVIRGDGIAACIPPDIAYVIVALLEKKIKDCEKNLEEI